MRENKLESIMTKTVKSLGGRSYKWVSPGNDGVPDRILCFGRGLHFMCEIKTEAGRTSAIQNVQINRLMRLQQNVCICYGMKGFTELLDIVALHTADPKVLRMKDQLEARYQEEDPNYEQGKLLINQTLQDYLEKHR